MQKIEPSGNIARDFFGKSTALADQKALVGAPSEAGAGSVYCYVFKDGSWSESQQIPAPDGSQVKLFGHCICVDGTTAIIGAKGIDKAGFGVFIFKYNSESKTWEKPERLKLDGIQEVDSVAYGYTPQGYRACVGGDGKVLIFTRIFDSSTGSYQWTLFQTLEDKPYTQFGNSIALADTALVVGAPYGGDTLEGAAYYYSQKQDGSFEETERIAMAPHDKGSWTFTELGTSIGTTTYTADKKLLVAVGAPPRGDRQSLCLHISRWKHCSYTEAVTL